MTDRETLITAFLDRTIWKGWQRIPVTGDASNRRYWRLTSAGQSVILMDDSSDLGGDTVPFAQIAQLLLNEGLCAPHILAHDAENGLMVLSDLGTNDIAAWLRKHPDAEETLYRAATDVLISLHNMAPPDHLDRMTPASGAAMLDLVGSHYARRDITDLEHAMQSALSEFAPVADKLALRDFHAENLIWRPAHEGQDRIGLLDFQDAFIAPAGYDLVSLLRDARRDVSANIAAQMIHYFIENTDVGPAFKTQLACVGIQRNLRILGIFGRLSLDYGKPRYLDLIPRVWGHIETDLGDPALSDLNAAVRDTVPAPTPACLKGLQA